MHKILFRSLVLALLVASTTLYAATPNRTSLVADGVTIYLGIVPAEIVRSHPSEHPEATMHGGATVGDHHIMIALFEEKSGKRIENADVSATVTGPKRYREEKKLEPMLVASAPSYGNYFSPHMPGSYGIALRIRLAGAPRDIHATFNWTLPGSE